MRFPAAIRIAASILAAAASLCAGQAWADTATSPAEPHETCAQGTCSLQLTAPQMLALAEHLVADKRYDEAAPIVAALRAAPDMEIPARFLAGMAALEQHDTHTAVSEFRAILNIDPAQTRVRLELARALVEQGDYAAADYHLRLAQHADDLPPDIAREVQTARNILRSKRNWSFGIDVGIAPDTNINSATNAQTVDVNFGPIRLPLTLDPQARSRSGTGITASAFGNLRIPLAKGLSLATDLDAGMVNYGGKDYDDYTVQLAAGPELRLGAKTTITAQAVGLQRWYGGATAARQFGGKLTLQRDLGTSQRIGLQFDGRHTTSDFGEGYIGWQYGLAVNYDHVIGKSTIASLAVFGRREDMDFAAMSSKSAGINLGLGKEFPFGINGGVAGGVSYAIYDQPQFFYSAERRHDWRWNGRAWAGLRSVRVLGFSPSVEYQFSKTGTNYVLYQSTRHRVQFKLAKYF